MRFNRFDQIVWSVAALLVAMIAVVIWRGDRVGVLIRSVAPIDAGQAAASSPIRIEFGQAMDVASVESRFAIEPAVAGIFVWSGDILNFLPSQAFEVGTRYQVTLRLGIETQLGHISKKDYSWSFHARQAGVTYLIEDEQGYEMWARSEVQSEPVRLSDPAASVFDYAVSVNGEHVLYSLVNEVGGIDLWIVDRNGEDWHLLLDCGADRCYAADWSVDGRIAYSRSPAPMAPGQAYGAPRIWLLDDETGETLRLHADTQKIGYGPSWSPNGQKLAYYDGVAGLIVVVDMLTGNETNLSSRVGIVGTWSPDSTQMIYYDTQIVDGVAANILFRADFESQDILPFFDPQPTDADYSNPIVSPDGEWVAVKVKSHGSQTGDQIWVMPVDGRFGLVVADEPEFLYSNISWNPWSNALIFYRIRLGTADREPEVWLWEQETGDLTLLAAGASSPAWLP